MPQTPIFSSMLGSSCSGQVQPDMGERCVDPVYQDGNLVSGSLEALIERLVPTMDYYPDGLVQHIEKCILMRQRSSGG
ncbi:ras-gef domain-containing family member 1a isoform x1 [Limosa lapponica baueri]|uniref:Ras-gef domain-containing family member 1a isoform x1 n=1 Tax=Limosa lapponica baueri TaxID=1758121 RepID=A0A2I0TYU8_LIMLA|nr:ras-gef domain-containing family member 1a isoform x1 [Limosa lapponica baueri]